MHLPDGPTLTVRRLRGSADDRDAVATLVSRCDQAGLARRFGGPGAPQDRVRWLLPRQAGDIALLACGFAPVAVLNANRTPAGEVEVGILVVPEWRGRGVATGLLRRLRAVLPAPVTITAQVQGDNRAALRLRRRLATDAAIAWSHGVMQFSLELAAASPSVSVSIRGVAAA